MKDGKKIANKAYKKIQSSLEELKKVAGDRSMEILGMTPMGQMLGLGPPI